MNEQKDCSEAIDATLEQLSRVLLPPAVESKLRARVQEFYVNVESAPAAAAFRPSISRYCWVGAAAGLAAAVLLAAAIFSVGARDAWAQVAKSLRAKPWVRMKFQIPSDPRVQEAPAELREQPPEIWFSAQHKTAAVRAIKSARYFDLARGERWRYEPQENTVYLESTSDRDQLEFEHLNTLLRLVVEGDQEPQLPKSPIEFVERNQREVRDGDRTWTEFTFQCRDPARSPPDFTTALRVDPASHLPSQMRTTHKMPNGEKAADQTFVFDYPETGPADIYALGVARSAKVVERPRPAGMKELRAAHAEARQRRIEPYSAVVVTSLPQADFSDILTAARVQCDGQTWRVEYVDLGELQALRERVYSKQIAPPKDDPASWWNEQVALLSFTDAHEYNEPWGVAVIPDAAAYFMLGDPSDPETETTLDGRPVIGPPDTIFLSIRTAIGRNTFWFDPKRDHAVVRFESPSGDNFWPISVQIIEKLEKSPGGRWYATQVRGGCVEKSGDEPRADVGAAPVATVVSRFFVEFD